MTDDLVKRLRTKYCCSAWADDCNCGEAADRIEALEAEVERLRGMKSVRYTHVLEATGQIVADGQRIAELEAALNGLLDEITLNKGDVLDSRAAGMAYAALLLGGKQ